jgi:diguanylate cyclase (GGDEF)-like protein
LAVPLRKGDGVCAVAYVSSSRAPLRGGAIAQLVEQSAGPFALALEREDDRARATFDSLTGLYTPRALRDLLRADVAAARTRENVSFALWFIDTDRFKAVNDAYGHAAGDEVLQTMAALLRAHTTAGLDTPARNGGDEFCAIVRDVHKVAAIERAKQFCEAVRAYDFGRYGPLTASVGVAAFPYDAREAGALLELADAAMYNSKREGRDRVSFCRAGGFAVHR